MIWSLIHPSRGRPQQAFNTMIKWVTHCSSSVQYILSLDRDDPARGMYYTLFLKTPPNIDLKIIEDDNKNLIDAIKRTVSFINGDCVISISDDFDCPVNWDIELQKVIGDKKDYAIRVQDGYVRADNPIMTLPILSRSIIERLGYIYYHQYTGMWADNDLFEVCQKLGVIQHTFLTFEHKHWVNKKAKRDATYDRHNTQAGYDFGKRLLDERRLRNFDL